MQVTGAMGHPLLNANQSNSIDSGQRDTASVSPASSQTSQQSSGNMPGDAHSRSAIPGSIALLLGMLVVESVIAGLLTAHYGANREPVIGWYQSVAAVWMVGLPSLLAAWWGVLQIRKDVMKAFSAVFGSMAIHFFTLVIGCTGLVLLFAFNAAAVFFPGLLAFVTCLVIGSSAYRSALRDAPDVVAKGPRRPNRGRRNVETSRHTGDNGPDQNRFGNKNHARTEVTS